MAYAIYIDETYLSSDAYLCKGMLLTDNPRAKVAVRKLECTEEQLLVCKHEEDECCFIYRAFEAPKDDPWFLSMADLFQYYHSSIFSTRVETVLLWLRELRPITFPIRYNLVEGKKGVQCRFTPHPEQDGLKSKGKFFFPDRRWKDACKGPAVITCITKESDGYGFIMGHMVNFENESPDRNTILQYLFDYRKHADSLYSECHDTTKIFTIDHPSRGKYIAIGHLVWSYRDVDNLAGYHFERMVLVDSGVGLEFESIITEDILDGYMTSCDNLTDFLLKEKFGLSVKDIAGKIHLSDRLAYPLSANWYKSNKVMPEIIEKAMELGVLIPYDIAGFKTVSLDCNVDKFIELYSLSPEELDEMFAEVEKINTAADNAIVSKVRKAKVSIL